MGTAYTGNVYLSKQHLKLDKTYIGLKAQSTLQIVNKSKVKVDFEWRTFNSEKDEIEKKTQLYN